MNKKAIMLYPFNTKSDDLCIGKEIYNCLTEQHEFQVIRISMTNDDGTYKQTAKEAFDLIQSGFNPLFILASDYGPWPGLGWSKENFPNTILAYETGDEPASMGSHIQKSLNSDVIFTPHALCNAIYNQHFGKRSVWWTQFAMESIYSKEYDVISRKICVTSCGEDRGPVTRYMKECLGDRFINKKICLQEEHAKFLSSGNIVFQESKCKEVTRRIMEGAALGKLVLADRPSEDSGYRELFTEGEEIVWYDSEKDAVEKAEYYLERPDECKRIGQNARRRVLSEHTTSARVKQLVDVIESISQ